MNKFLTAFIALIICFAADAQDRITMSVSDVSLKEALEDLQKQSGCEIIFADSKVNLDQKVSFSIERVSLNEALDEILGRTDVSWSLHDRKVILTRKQSQGGQIKIKILPVTQGKSLSREE